jgi:hypothetical protein
MNPALFISLFPSIQCLLQMVFFLAAAIAHGTAFVRWRQKSADEKLKSWQHFGMFTGLSFLGSVSGLLAYAARMGNMSHIYISSHIGLGKNVSTADMQKRNEVLHDMLLFSAAHWMMLPLELGFVIAAKLYVLHRMRKFSMSIFSQGRAWLLFGRLFFLAICVCNFIGFCTNIAASVHFIQSASLYGQAAQAWASNDASAARSFQIQAGSKTQDGVSIASVQRFCEVVVLIMMIVSYIAVGIASYRVVASALITLFKAEMWFASAPQQDDRNRILFAKATAQGKLLQLKIVCTFVFVFATVLVRSLFTIMYALAQRFQDYGNSCSPSQCDTCKNVYSNILFWIINTPTFQFVVLLISSPLALLVSLWGMSGVKTMEQMSSQQSQMNSLRSQVSTSGDR